MNKSLIPVFPGTNCDKETLLWINDNLETCAEFLDIKKHASLKPEDVDLIIVPGGFSYGDYLRAGAIAARSKEMGLIAEFANKNVPIMGICNGFQILCESRLLPGTLVKNTTRQHHHFPVSIKINPEFLNTNSSKNCVWLPKLADSQLQNITNRFANFEIPMSCGMGNWRPPLHEAEKLQAEQNAILHYNNNENGSYNAIAGLVNSAGNVLGIMPHPERASDIVIGSREGLLFLYGIAQNKKIKIKEGSELWQFTMSF
ncbi:MAG: phosphoribosylformylglycinamidine synthase subunit PurQ [Bdellovibrionota bacterium]